MENRATTSLARLLRDTNRRDEARDARRDLQLVHRGLRHRRSEGRQGAARRTAILSSRESGELCAASATPKGEDRKKMSSIAPIAKSFFDACEAGKSWAVARSSAGADAILSAQAEPLIEIRTLDGTLNG